MPTSKPQPLVLFGLERSVYTRIVRLALEEKEIPHSLHEVEIFGPGGVPGAHMKRHPFGRIPVLQHDDFILYETNAITRYIDEAFPGPVLQPTEAPQRARMNQVISLMDAYAYRPMVWGVFVQRVHVSLKGGLPNEPEIEASLLAAATCLASLDALIESRQFLAGEHISLADLHAFAILRYFCLAPEGHALLKGHPALLRWYDAMLTRKSVSQTTTSYERA